MKKVIPNWCSWPDQKRKRDDHDLYRQGVRVDAWRSFFESRFAKKLRSLSGHVLWFNRYESFDRLICEFDCDPIALTKAITKAMRFPTKIELMRNDIYDMRAWITLPLAQFCDVPGAVPRTTRHRFADDALDLNEVPLIQFGLKIPWTVSRECFTISHRKKDGGRFAEMAFRHPQLDSRFDGSRWVADGMFDVAATREHMFSVLFAKVMSRAETSMFSISPDVPT